MKLIVKSLCTAFIIAVIYSVIPFQAQCENISNDVFRLHVLANSDSEYDQSIKLKVRDKVLEYSEDMFKNAASKEQAESLTAENLTNIEQIANNELKRLGCNYTAEAEIKNKYFTTSEYSDYTLQSGMYDALRITLGKGEGHNWWCVMYPSICLSAATEREDKAKQVYTDGEYQIVTNEQPEYKFKIVELFEQLHALFR